MVALHTFSSFCFSFFSSIPAFCACRFSDLTVN